MIGRQKVLGCNANGAWLDGKRALAGIRTGIGWKKGAFPEDRKQRRQREAGRKKGNGKGEDGKEAQGDSRGKRGGFW